MTPILWSYLWQRNKMPKDCSRHPGWNANCKAMIMINHRLSDRPSPFIWPVASYRMWYGAQRNSMHRDWLLTTPCIGSDRAIINYVKGKGSREGQIKPASFLSFRMLKYTHTHNIYRGGTLGGPQEEFPKTVFGNTFWLECPTDVKSMPLSFIFDALFRDTQLGHVCRTQPNCQIAKLAKYRDIWLIWLFGDLAACDKHARVGYPWKEHQKCSSEALTLGP